MKNQINAVLVRLSICIFPNSRQDRVITEEVKIKKALGVGAGKWTKYKLPNESLQSIRNFVGIVHDFNRTHTCVWEDGQRLLSADARPHYDARMEEFKTEFFKLVDEFGEQYPNWIAQAQIMHAATYEPSDYPSWSLCRQMFSFEQSYFPVPKPEHFNKDMQSIYGAGLEAITEKKVTEAAQDSLDRLLKPVRAMAERLASPDAIFRDTLVENVKEMVSLVPSLNPMNDPKLAEAAKLIESTLATLSVETLRESKVDRKDAAEKAANIIARFSGIGKRKLAA